MFKRLLPLIAVLTVAAIPAAASASRVHHDNTSPITASYGYSIMVYADCDLTVTNPGTITFPAISALNGSSGENASSSNTAQTDCAGTTTTTLSISDAAQTNGPDYVLTGANSLDYEICSTTNGGGTCYTNSSASGISVGNGLANTTLDGWLLPVAGPINAGNSTDTVTVQLAWT